MGPLPTFLNNAIEINKLRSFKIAHALDSFTIREGLWATDSASLYFIRIKIYYLFQNGLIAQRKCLGVVVKYDESISNAEFQILRVSNFRSRKNPPFPKKSEAWVPFIILSLRTVCPTLRASAETALPCSSAESWSSSVSGSSQRTTCPSLNEWVTRSPALTFSFHARDPDFLSLCRNSSSGCRRDHWLASLSRFSRHWMVTPSGCKAAAERTIQSPESVLRSVFISFRSSSNTARSCAKASFPSSSYRSSILRALQHRAVRS